MGLRASGGERKVRKGEREICKVSCKVSCKVLLASVLYSGLRVIARMSARRVGFVFFHLVAIKGWEKRFCCLQMPCGHVAE